MGDITCSGILEGRGVGELKCILDLKISIVTSFQDRKRMGDITCSRIVEGRDGHWLDVQT